MRSAPARVVAVLLTVAVGVGAAGCRKIPEDASKKDFCGAGEKFSASNTFGQGVSSAKRLAEVGTPKDISSNARDGFVQLIDRVLDAKDGQDFIKKSKKLDAGERKNLKALDAYIQKTCKS